MYHYKNICMHGNVVSQCRCPGPKTTKVVPCSEHQQIEAPLSNSNVITINTPPKIDYHSEPHQLRRAELNRVSQLLIDTWEKAEGEKVGVSYIATFVDMARAVIADREKSD